jgi:hypothetical protein
MATRNSTRRFPPELIPILGRFSDALAVVTVVHRSLAGGEVAGAEESALRTALGMLSAVYNELDAAGRRS